MKKYIHYFIDNINNLNGLREECLNSWKNNLPQEYEIKIWTLEDLNKIDTKEAKKIKEIEDYNTKKHFLEVYAIYNFGGIFIDQNIKSINSLEDILENSSSFLGVDEKGTISPSIWYASKPKNSFSTKVYNLFKENLEEGLYNSFFLELSLIFKQILIDFDSSNEQTQKLADDVIIYSADFFYPYSYDGHTKNTTNNTKAINYFHYNFITPKGKLKNIIYAIFGESLTKTFSKFFIFLKQIFRIILYPYLQYRRTKRKMTEKHKKLVAETTEKINKLTDENYVAFHNPEWTGVSNATIELFKNSVPCGELITNKEIKLIKNTIVANNIKEVVFSGFAIGWYELAKLLHKEGVIVKTFFHGSHSQYKDEYGWKMNKQIYLLERKGIVSEMAFCKKSIINFYKDKDCNVSFLRNIVNIDYDIKKKAKRKDEVRIGIYAVQTIQWRKNVFTSLASIYFLKNKMKDKDIVVDIVPKSPTAEIFCHILDIKTTGIKKAIPREELLQRMSDCDITLYVTFTECAPMVPLESFYVETPCITGNNHHYFKDTELEKYIVVNNENNPIEVAEKIEMCLENKKKVFELYNKFSEENLNAGLRLVKEYLKIGGKSNE